eukprot:COSAG05_NODE_12768_length_455_cov_1.016854_1_plen_60_part_10
MILLERMVTVNFIRSGYAAASLNTAGAPSGDFPEDDILERVGRAAIEPLRKARTHTHTHT